MNILDRLKSKAELIRDRDMWRAAYEALVAQTGRDLNDGWGIDPRKRTSKEANPHG
jgi:hypothetical protein